MGITTFRDVGCYDDLLVEARQAMRYGAFDGPRVLACGRIVSATSPGRPLLPRHVPRGRRRRRDPQAVREQMRYGADFIKVMTTGARSVELEDPDPAQLTREEVRVARRGVAPHGLPRRRALRGLAGTEIAIEEGIDTIEHGMYLNQRPDLLERMARDGPGPRADARLPLRRGGLGERIGASPDDEEYQGGGGSGIKRPPMPTWTPLLVDLAMYNVEQAALTIQAARAAGVTIAMGFDWGPAAPQRARAGAHDPPRPDAARRRCSRRPSASALALGLEEHVGTIETGKLADLLVVDGDPLARPEVLLERESIWLVTRLGKPVAGTSLERDPARPAAA